MIMVRTLCSATYDLNLTRSCNLDVTLWQLTKYDPVYSYDLGMIRHCDLVMTPEL